MKKKNFKRIKLVGLTVATIISFNCLKSKDFNFKTKEANFATEESLVSYDFNSDNKNVSNINTESDVNIVIGDMETEDEKKAMKKFEKMMLKEAKKEHEKELKYMKLTNEKKEEKQNNNSNNYSAPKRKYNLSTLQKYAHELVIDKYGWSEDDFNCLVSLWNRESGWNPNSHNSSSGAHGIPQALPASKMASEGEDYYTNGKTQIRWGLKYIKNRYGTPSSAWGHFKSRNWY